VERRKDDPIKGKNQYHEETRLKHPSDQKSSVVVAGQSRITAGGEQEVLRNKDSLQHMGHNSLGPRGHPAPVSGFLDIEEKKSHYTPVPFREDKKQCQKEESTGGSAV